MFPSSAKRQRKIHLVKLIMKLLKPSGGSIETAASLRIGYVPQKHEAGYSGFPITV